MKTAPKKPGDTEPAPKAPGKCQHHWKYEFRESQYAVPYILYWCKVHPAGSLTSTGGASVSHDTCDVQNGNGNWFAHVLAGSVDLGARFSSARDALLWADARLCALSGV